MATESLKIIIPGGSGQVGTLLARAFTEAGHEVIILSRTPQQRPWRVVAWDAHSLGEWTTELENSDVVINLAGRSVNCRYTAENRRAIMDSRVLSTRLIGRAIAQAKKPPKLWLQSSTATIYAHSYDRPHDELTGVLGGQDGNRPDSWQFSIEVAKAWEQALAETMLPQTRKVALRSAMVMSPDQGGIFDTLLGLVRLGLGGTAGHGRQIISWIHEYDFIRAISWLIAHDELEGAVNLVSPEPLSNADFMRGLRQAWGMHVGLPASNWMLELGAWFMRTETELILKSRYVVPGRLLASGFQFSHANWYEAAQELCQRWREEH